jgi:hypothetical protein
MALAWFHVVHPDHYWTRKLRTELKPKIPRIIIAGRRESYLALNRDHHQGDFMRKMIKDYNVKSHRVVNYEDIVSRTITVVPCGVEVAGNARSVSSHSSHCKSCKSVNSPPKLRLADDSDTAIGASVSLLDYAESDSQNEFNVTLTTGEKVDKGDLDISGLLRKLQVIYSQAMNLAESSDVAIQAIKRVDDIEAKMRDLKAQQRKARSELREL